MKTHLNPIFLSLFLIVFSTQALSAFPTIDPNIYFPGIAQGHSNTSQRCQYMQLEMYQSAQINGTQGNKLDFCSSSQGAGLPNDSCDDASGGHQSCRITKDNAPTLSLGSFQTTDSPKFNICKSGTREYKEDQYKRIEVRNSCIASIKNSNHTTYLTGLAIEDKAKMTLNAGDYWIKNLSVLGDAEMKISGDVRLFVYDDLILSNQIKITLNPNASLYIIGYHNIQVNDSASAEAYIYANDTLSLNNKGYILGRVSSRKLYMGGSTFINKASTPPPILPLTCYEDNFNSGNLDSSWVTSSSNGDFIPKIINGRLQLTQAKKAQSTASSYQYLYPALGNKIEVEFDYMAYGGTGADGLAVVFSDAEITPQAGAFGGPLGYGFKNNREAKKPGFKGGWLGIGLDEHGNYSKEGGSKNHSSYSTDQSVVLRGSGHRYTGYNYLYGKQVHNIDNNNGSVKTHRYRITIDSRNNNTANVTVERSVEPKGSTPRFRKIIGPINVLSPQYNQDEIPENFIMSLTGSTGQLYNTHEIDNFRVCALHSTPIGKQIDHFEFDHSGQGSTCDVSNVTLKACGDASCSNSNLFTDKIDISLNTNNLGADGYWLNGNNITMTGGIAKLSVGKPTQGNVNLDIDGSSPSTKPFSNTLCSINGGSLNSQNCTLNFKSEGLTVIVPDKLANKSVTATIKGCGSSFTGTKNIQLWSDYISPNNANIIGSPSLYGLVNNSWNEIGKQEASPTTFALNFANNEAQITVNYVDAGKLQLNAKYKKSYNQDIEGSDQFVSFPMGLSASVTGKNNSALNGLCGSEDTSCPVFARAGEAFSLNIKAHAWMGDNDNHIADNLVTPNYAQHNLILDHTLIAPSQKIGGNTGNLLVNTYYHAATKSGMNTVHQSISEVGVFDISVTPPTDYLGSNAFQIKAANTGSIGRFIPAYFDLSAVQPTIKDTCGNFTYLGQTFVFDTLPTLEVTPLSYTGGQLQNYSIGQWWRYNKVWDFRTYSASPSNIEVIDSDSLSILGRRDGFAISGSVVKLPLQNKVQLQNAKLRYNKPFDPISPTNDTITLALTAEDIEDQDGVCYKLSATGNCLNYNFPTTPEHRQEWGRITMEDAYGSELNDLQSRIETESYDFGRFIRNSDSCTKLSLSDFSFDVGNNPNALPVGEGTTKASLTSTNMNELNFTAPGNGNQGRIIPTLSLVNRPWLQQDQDNNDSFEDFIKATIHFGIYRGSDRIIWSHEQTN
ncbi:hypothetical protein PVK62_14305 [Aliivibrio sp. S3MY1]|uniref:DUF6701 domain-containing protein n=1 Tax=unclassified Aliivibrio TaxID=2645654 RepID=UPI002379CD3F|nr:MULTISPECIES: DUF6701 domain-containing protein [unclassified Aliivibrio]MDD9196996.1 hypothetical protein [Aliivibrio sp. S3MY1]MDD9198090.1 hypothetical protein [Aliivibrio sp. S2MY1]